MKVTLIIDPGNGQQERYEVSSTHGMATPCVLQVTNAALASRKSELELLKEVAKLFATVGGKK